MYKLLAQRAAAALRTAAAHRYQTPPCSRRTPRNNRRLLIIIPFAFLELRPEATKALLKHTQDWLLSHAVRLMAAIALLLGAYLAVSGLVRLS